MAYTTSISDRDVNRAAKAKTNVRDTGPRRFSFAMYFPYLCLVLIGGLVLLDVLLGANSAGPMSASGAGHGMHGMAGLPAPLYYGSIAAVLLVSFGVIEWRAARQAKKSSLRRADRFDLLRISGFRRVLVHSATRPLAQGIVVALFALIVATGLFGNQLPNKNLAPTLTWTVWWCGLVLLVLYAGKAWCYVCPWDAIAGWAEGLRFRSPGRARLSLALRWPKALRNIWPATILFVALTWLELGFNVTTKPRATAWLALGMLAFAFVSAFLFERKSFCRYGCLVGRISGLYALFAPVEVRAANRDLCRSCGTRSCYHGNDRGAACPTSQYLGTMDQNTYCVSCMECLKTCELDNVAVRLRPWGADLFTHRRPRADEAYLALLMLALTGFHGLTMTASWRRMVDGLRSQLGVGEGLSFSAGMIAIITGPILLYALLVAVSRLCGGKAKRSYRECFLRYAYALLPIALFYHLAHNSGHLLTEGQRLIALASDPFGFEWDLFGTAHWMPRPLLGMQALWVLQVGLVLAGHVYSLVTAHRAAQGLFPDPRAARRSQIPMLVAMILFSVMSLWLLKEPMQMRMSWM